MIINKKLQMRLLARNIRYSYIDGMAFSFMLGATTPYLGVYILRFHGPAELVSLISSIQPMVSVIVCLLAASYANSFQKKKPLLIPTSLIIRTFILIIAFIPFLPSSWHAWTFFIIWGISYIPWALCNLSWTPMMSNIIPEEQRGRFFGVRNTLTGLTSLIGTVLTGIVLTKLRFNLAFMWVFFISYLITMISMYFLNRHIEPLVPEEGESKTNTPANANRIFKLDLQSNFKIFQDPVYGYIFGLSCIAIFIFHMGYSMVIPLFTLRQIKQLGFDNGAVAIIANIMGITALLGSYLSGFASDRWGFRYVLLFSTLFSVIPPIVWALTAKFSWLIFASLLWGLTVNAYLICFNYMVLKVSPFKDRSRFVAMNTVIGNLAAGLGPVLGLVLVKIPLLNIQGALIIGALIMLAGSLFSFLVVKKGSF